MRYFRNNYVLGPIALHVRLRLYFEVLDKDVALQAKIVCPIDDRWDLSKKFGELIHRACAA
jgi:hypothetical protein